MHERNGAQLVFLAALGAVNSLMTVVVLALCGRMSLPLGIMSSLTVATAWAIWFGALRSWIRSVRVTSALKTSAPRSILLNRH